MSGTTKPDWKQPALDYYREILLRKKIKKPPYFSTTERSFLAFFLLTKVKLQSAEPTDKGHKTTVCESQSERKLFNIKLGKKSAKEFYTLIRFYENRLNEAFSQNFHPIIQSVFEDLKKLCGYDDNKTDFVNETDAHRISKIMNKIGSVLEIDYNIENQVADEIRKKGFQTKEDDTKKNLLGKFVAPAPVATTVNPIVLSSSAPTLGSGDFSALLKNIRTKFPDVPGDVDNCEQLFTGVDVAKYETLFKKCTDYLQNFVDALKKDDPSLTDDLTMTNYYERLNKLNDDHTEHVNKEIASVNNTMGSDLEKKLDFSTENTFAKIKAEVEKIGLKELYKDLYEKITTKGITETNILEKLDKKNYNFAQKMGFFTVGAVGATAGLAVGAVGATGYVVSMPFIKLYETLKNRKSAEASGFTPVVPSGATSDKTSGVSVSTEKKLKPSTNQSRVNVLPLGQFASKPVIENELKTHGNNDLSQINIVFPPNIEQGKVNPILEGDDENVLGSLFSEEPDQAAEQQVAEADKQKQAEEAAEQQRRADQAEEEKQKQAQQAEADKQKQAEEAEADKQKQAEEAAEQQRQADQALLAIQSKNLISNQSENPEEFNEQLFLNKLGKNLKGKHTATKTKKTLTINVGSLRITDFSQIVSFFEYNRIGTNYEILPFGKTYISNDDTIVLHYDINNTKDPKYDYFAFKLTGIVENNEIITNNGFGQDGNGRISGGAGRQNIILNIGIKVPKQDSSLPADLSASTSASTNPDQNSTPAAPGQKPPHPPVTTAEEAKRLADEEAKRIAAEALQAAATKEPEIQASPTQRANASQQPQVGIQNAKPPKLQRNEGLSKNLMSMSTPNLFLNTSSSAQSGNNSTANTQKPTVTSKNSSRKNKQNTKSKTPNLSVDTSLSVTSGNNSPANTPLSTPRLGQNSPKQFNTPEPQALIPANVQPPLPTAKPDLNAQPNENQTASPKNEQQVLPQPAAQVTMPPHPPVTEEKAATKIQNFLKKQHLQKIEQIKQTNATTKIQAKTRQYFTKKQIKQMLQNLKYNLGLQGTFQEISSNLNNILEKIRNLLEKNQSLPKPGNTLSSLTAFVHNKEHEKYLQALGYKDSPGVLKIYHQLASAASDYATSKRRTKLDEKQKRQEQHLKLNQASKEKKVKAAKDSFALVNEPYPEGNLSSLFPKLNLNLGIVNYWKVMSKPDKNDDEILKDYLPEYTDFKKYVLENVYKIKYDSQHHIGVKGFSEHFVYLCALLEGVIQIFGSTDIYNTVFKHFLDNCQSNYLQNFNSELENLIQTPKTFNPIQLLKYQKLVNIAMFSYFRDLLFACLTSGEINLIKKIIDAKNSKTIHPSCQEIYFASFKFYVFKQTLFKYFLISQYVYSYSVFLTEAEKNMKIKKPFDVFELLNDLYYEDENKEKKKYTPPKKIKTKGNLETYWFAPEALEKIASSFDAGYAKTSGGRSLTRKIIKKSNPNKNAQTKKNKGRRDQLRKGGQTRRRSSASISSSNSRTRRIRRQ